MEKRKFNPCSLAIIKTLSYSGVFNYPLSFYQISTNLISKTRFSKKQINRELKKLIKSGMVEEEDSRYYLSGIEPANWKEKEKSTKKFVDENISIIKVLEKVPWIKMIAITGSAANYNIDEKADIDLLFVTHKKRLWITRGFVFLILKILNKLPKETKDRKICPNIFVDERYVSWPKKKRNLYVAQNIISMQPIFNRDEAFFKFIFLNKWINKYFSNFLVIPSKMEPSQKRSGSLVVDLLEHLSRKMQTMYMKRKITTETVNKKIIHFNKNDNSKRILSEYKKLLKTKTHQ